MANQEDFDKIETEEAKRQMENRRAMAKEDELNILAKGIQEHHVWAEEEPNWAIYNYILSIVDFKDCKVPRDFGHRLFRHLWPYIKRYHNDRVKLMARLEDLGVELDMPPSPRCRLCRTKSSSTGTRSSCA